MSRRYVVWTKKEKEALAKRMVELHRAKPTISLKDALAQAQATVFPPDRRRPHVTGYKAKDVVALFRKLAGVPEKRVTNTVKKQVEPNPVRMKEPSVQEPKEPNRALSLDEYSLEALISEVARRTAVAVIPRVVEEIRRYTEVSSEPGHTVEPVVSTVMQVPAAKPQAPKTKYRIEGLKAASDKPTLSPTVTRLKPAKKKKKVIVIGLKGQQKNHVDTAIHEELELVFCDVNRLRALSSSIRPGDTVVLMTKFISHKAQQLAAAANPEQICYCNGGTSSLNDVLMDLATQ